MTIPYERTRAVLSTEQFLKELAYERKGVPKLIRAQAASLLRHYPTAADLVTVARGFGYDVHMQCPFAHPDEDFFGNMPKKDLAATQDKA